METQKIISNGPAYTEVDGFVMSANFKPELVRSAIKYRPRSNDLFLATFPKCGTFWASHIVYLIFTKGVPPSCALDILLRNPTLEMVGAKVIEAMTLPGLIVTHLPHRLTPWDSRAKYIYVCRNPKDVCVSFFIHTRTLAGYEYEHGQFEDFFEIFMSGKNSFGDYFEHVTSWYAHSREPNVLFLHYEDMKRDPRYYVLEIAKFMGNEYHTMLLQNEGILENVVELSSIKRMKQYADQNFKDFFGEPITREDVPEGLRNLHKACQRRPGTGSPIRNGVVGGWKTFLTSDMNVRMEEKILQKLSHTNIVDVWRRHGVMRPCVE